MTRTFLEKCRRIMLDNGLEPPDTLEGDGRLHRCGTETKPHEKDGAYILHLDGVPSLWWQNWSTGTSGTHSAKPEISMSKTERATYQKHVAAIKKQREQELQARHKEAAQKAQRFWQKAKAASPDHAYLVSKGVGAHALKTVPDGRLFMPLYNDQGHMQTGQFIGEDGEKRLLTGGKKAGAFYAITSKNTSKENPLCIVEGYATGASVHEATGYAVLVAVDAGNLKAIATMVRRHYPERTIILCADNDADKSENVGVRAATAAAKAINGLVAIPPSHDGKAMDFNGLHQCGDLNAVAICIEDAIASSADDDAIASSADDDTSSNEEHVEIVSIEEIAVPCVKEAVTEIIENVSTPTISCENEEPRNYQIRHDGIWHVEPKLNAQPIETWLCGPLKVLGKTRDTQSSAWGRLLEWSDDDGVVHRWAMPLKMLLARDSAWLAYLVDKGLHLTASGKGRNLLAMYLAAHNSAVRIRCTDAIGWHGNTYVLPDMTLSHDENQENVVLQSITPQNPYCMGGELRAWQKSIGTWARGNSRLMFAISAALSGILLEPLGMENGGFNFVGGSSTGKTTALCVAASAYGKGAGQGGYIRTWRSTDNGLEGIARLHNDAALLLDELGQAPSRVTQSAVYMLGNGQGKARAKQDGAAKAGNTWRVVILSTGEKGIGEKIAEEGGRVQAGQIVRIVDIPTDAGQGLGIFEELHGHKSARVFADALKSAAAMHYGHGNRQFIDKVIASKANGELEEVRNFMEKGLELICPDSNADGQVLRVARRFLLAAAAGEVAAGWGIVPWEKGEALQAAKICFEAWLAQRGGMGAYEDQAALDQVVLFWEQHGQSRFQDIDKPDTICINRVGYSKRSEKGTEYFILPESFKAEVCKGLNCRRVAKILDEAGLLLRDSPHHRTKQVTTPDFGRKRCYVILIRGNDNVVE